MRRLTASLCVFVFSAAIAASASAAAVEVAWPFRAGGEVALGYGAAWTSGGQARTHRGVDIPASGSSPVVAPVGGTVSFAGLVPSDSGRVGAVTIARDDGTRMTLMPLEEMDVSTGERIECGARVGSLASEGDASTSAPHVHVSLRRGDTYLDPLTVLVAPEVGEGADASETAAEPASAGAPSASPVHVAEAAPVASPSQAPSPRTQPSSGITPIDAQSPVVDSPKLAVTSDAPDPAAAAPQVSGARAASGRTKTATSAELPDPTAGLMRSALAAARKAVAWGSAALLATLSGLGLLWPMRRRAQRGESQDVIAGGEDVAAAVIR